MADQGEPTPIDPKYASLTSDQAQTVATAEKPLEEAIKPLRGQDLTPEQQGALKKMEDIVSDTGFSALKVEQEGDPRINALLENAKRVMNMGTDLDVKIANEPIRSFISRSFNELADNGVRRIITEAGDNLVTVPEAIITLNGLLNRGIEAGIPKDAAGPRPIDLVKTYQGHGWGNSNIADMLDGYIVTSFAHERVSEGLDAIDEAARLRGEPVGGLDSYIPFIISSRNLINATIYEGQKRKETFDKVLGTRGYVMDIRSGSYVNLAPQGSQSTQDK